MLEIIHLRLAGEDPRDLVDGIKESLRAGETLGTVLYRRRGLATDLAVVIVHAGTEPCPLGLRLASALQDHGLVEHTMWEEL